MDELQWVDALVERFSIPPRPGLVGPGDDAAVVPLEPGEAPVLTVDVMVDGVHFRDGWLTDAELARRSIRVSASDLAAMAAAPRGVLLSIETPELPGRVGETFWDGVDAELRAMDVPLLGGNVTRTSGPLSISATVLGGVIPGHEVLRSTARAGDEVWITGVPGRALAARREMEAGEPRRDPCPWRQPPNLLDAARELASRSLLSAAIDVSDGLGLDLWRLLEASTIGAVIDVRPLVELGRSQSFTGFVEETVLEGGEDYELLFTTAPGSMGGDELDDMGVFLTRIGVATAELGIRLRHGQEEQAYTPRGWDPFR